jgi:hypothetical protein
VADATLVNYVAGDLRQRGIAVWHIECRGVDRAGGGYPALFATSRRSVSAARNQSLS